MPAMQTDAELLRIYAEKHSEAAFAELVERRIGFVYGTALRQVAGHAHLAQDVAQSVFALVAKKAGALARHECLPGCLHATTTHAARRAWRDARTRKKYEEEAALMSGIQNDGTVAAGVAGAAAAMATPEEFARLRPLLDEALGALREEDRNAVLLRFFDGRGFAEIGARMRISEEAARKRVARAVEKMRVLLARRGVTSSAAALGALMSVEAAQAAPAGLAAAVTGGAMASAAVTSAAAAASASTLAGAGASGLLVFLGSTKIVTISAVALLLAAGAAFYGLRGERAAQAALDEAKRENALLNSRSRVSEQRRETSGAQATALAARDPVALGEAYLAAYPKVREALTAWARARTANTFYRLRFELGLSDAQWEQFLKIRGNVFGSWASVVRSYPPSPYDGAKTEILKPDENWREQMRAFLGDAGYARFQEEEKYITADSLSLAGALYFTDTPLTAEQIKKMDELVTAECNASEPYDFNAVWDSIVEKSGDILSEPQKQALMDNEAESKWNVEAQRLRGIGVKSK